MSLPVKWLVYIAHDSLTIQIVDDNNWCTHYEIDLEECTDSARVLDYIFQIQSKTWCTPELIALVLDTLNSACIQYFGQPAQGVFCSMGIGRKITWPEVRSLALTLCRNQPQDRITVEL